MFLKLYLALFFTGLSFAIPPDKNSKCIQNCLTSTKCTPVEGHLHSCNHKASLERFLKCVSSCEKKIPNGDDVHQELKKKLVDDSETNKRTNRRRMHSNSASIYKKIIESRKTNFKNIKSDKDVRTEANAKVSATKNLGNNATNDHKRLKRSLIADKIDALKKRLYDVKKRFREIIPNLISQGGLKSFNRTASIETLNGDKITHEELQYVRERDKKNFGNDTKRKVKRQIANEKGNSYVQANKRSPRSPASAGAFSSLNAGVMLGPSGISANVQANSKEAT